MAQKQDMLAFKAESKVSERVMREREELFSSPARVALATDFAGYEDIHRMCINAPKHGNDEMFVDSIAKDIFAFIYQEHQKKPDYLGCSAVQPGAYSVTGH